MHRTLVFRNRSLPLREEYRLPVLFFLVNGAFASWQSFYNLHLDRIGFSSMQIGILGALFIATAALILPIWGMLADRYGNNRVLLLINGLSITDNVFGVSYIGSELGLDVDAIERIEIVRGPGSVLYGTSAMLAVINIITKKGKTVDGLKLTLQPGSFGKIQGGVQFGKELKNGLDIFVSAHLADIKGQDLYFEEFDDPATNNGIAEGLDWEKYYGIFASLKYKNFSLQTIMSAREKGERRSWSRVV